MGKKIAGFLGVLASIAGILGLFVALNILHPLVPDPPLTPTLPTGTCIQGYVWREAVPNDHVCVAPETSTQTQEDNSQAQNRVASP